MVTNDLQSRTKDFDQALNDLETSRSFAALRHQQRTLARAQKLIRIDGGLAALYERAPRFGTAGLFHGGDWDHPDSLQSNLVRDTLLAGGDNAVIEVLSELRLLALATCASENENMDAADARRFLEELLAANMDILFPTATETDRHNQRSAPPWLRPLFQFLLDQLEPDGIMAALALEIERVLLQRPIMMQRVESLLRAARRAIEADSSSNTAAAHSIRYWVHALYGPSTLSRQQDEAIYASNLTNLDEAALREEAGTFGRVMSTTGLVSRQHALLLQYLLDRAPTLLPDVLALGPVGQVSLEQHAPLITAIIRFAIRPETARSIYGLARLLDHGTLFASPVPPGLQRLMRLPCDPEVEQLLCAANEWQHPPPVNVLLLAGTLSVLGQPRGVDQGNNPTCQAARAISLWAHNDPGYLLELIAHAAREGELELVFEGKVLNSRALQAGLAGTLDTELGAVALLLTPHLDRLYAEMSRRTAGRGEDGHKWINPEYHGWWVHRDFASAVDVVSGAIRNFDDFARRFYAAYHPQYNGGIKLVYAQPCGIASTNANAEFLGWHAVSIQRVALDPEGTWRVYFFNPNRDKGQDWGQGIVTSTCNHGEYEGEASLPVEQFAMRLYIFHYKQREMGDPAAVPAERVATIRAAVAAGWAAQRAWQDDVQPSVDSV